MSKKIYLFLDCEKFIQFRTPSNIYHAMFWKLVDNVDLKPLTKQKGLSQMPGNTKVSSQELLMEKH